jgi:hypothetical protein
VRVVRSPDGTIALDPTGRAAGRGAYLCRDASCWDAAGRKRALEHALGHALPADVTDILAAGPDALPGHQPQNSATGAPTPEPENSAIGGQPVGSPPTLEPSNSAIGAQPTAAEGGAEHRSERARMPVSEERTRQRPDVGGSAPALEPDSQLKEGGRSGQE